MSTGRLDLGNAGEEGGGREEDLRLEEEESVGADQDVAVGVDFEEISVQSIEPETSAAAKKKEKRRAICRMVQEHGRLFIDLSGPINNTWPTLRCRRN